MAQFWESEPIFGRRIFWNIAEPDTLPTHPTGLVRVANRRAVDQRTTSVAVNEFGIAGLSTGAFGA